MQNFHFEKLSQTFYIPHLSHSHLIAENLPGFRRCSCCIPLTQKTFFFSASSVNGRATKRGREKKLIEEVFSVFIFSNGEKRCRACTRRWGWEVEAWREWKKRSRKLFFRIIFWGAFNRTILIAIITSSREEGDSWARQVQGKCEMRSDAVRWSEGECEAEENEEIRGGGGGGCSLGGRRNETKPKIGLSFPSHISHCESYNALAFLHERARQQPECAQRSVREEQLEVIGKLYRHMSSANASPCSCSLSSHSTIARPSHILIRHSTTSSSERQMKIS